MAKLAGYLRVSSVGGREHLQSPAEQTAEIEGWARIHGHRVIFLESELDAKGSNPDRPIFREAVDGVKSGLYDGVVVAYLSRAGRDLRLMLDLWDEVEGAGGVVYSARENVDGSNPTSKMQRNFLASIAQHELEERREGFERATRSAVERGVWQRRQTPKGYAKDPETRRLVVVESEADEVRWAASGYLSGVPIVELSSRLGMTPGGVRALLRNRVYLGELKVRSYVNTEAHDPILEPAIFEAVNEKLDHGRRPPRSGEPALLAGIVRCQACGHIMGRFGGKDGKVYRCHKYHSGEVCPSPAAIGCNRLDPFVEAAAVRELHGLSGRASAMDGVAAAEREVGAAEAELSAFLQAVDAAGIGTTDAAAGMVRRRERLDAAREQLRASLARVPRLPDRIEGAAIWDRLNVSERNDLLRSLLTTVAVRSVGKGRHVAVTERVRIFKFGSGIALPKGRTGSASGLIEIPWPDLDDPRLVSVAGIEDAL